MSPFRLIPSPNPLGAAYQILFRAEAHELRSKDESLRKMWGGVSSKLRRRHSEAGLSGSVSSAGRSPVLSSRVGTIGAGRRGWMVRFPDGGGSSRCVTTTLRTAGGFGAALSLLLFSSSFWPVAMCHLRLIVVPSAPGLHWSQVSPSAFLISSDQQEIPA